MPSVRSSKSVPVEARRLSRDDWIDRAVHFLAASGVDALRIDNLAADLGVTKGSFYAHFSSREDLVEAVLDRWQRGISLDVQNIIAQRDEPPVDILRRLLDLSFVDDPSVPGGPFEMTLRGWARRDRRVREVMHYVDNARIADVRALYLEAGVRREAADAYALLHMTFVTGGRLMMGDASPEERERRRSIGHRYLIDFLLPDSQPSER